MALNDESSPVTPQPTAWTGGRHNSSAVCVLAPNPSPMTLDGTNTWVIHDRGEAVVVDPGPLTPSHLDALVRTLDEVDARPLTVLLTHGHADHSEGAGDLARRLGVGVRCIDPAFRLGDEGLHAGEQVDVGGLAVEVLGTPGHTSDSLTFAYRPAHADGAQGTEPLALLTGDTVLGRGTTVVAHPDGELAAYLDSLERLREVSRTEPGAVDVLPGHGPTLPDATGILTQYLDHRQMRLAQIREALGRLSDQPLQAAAADVPAMDVVRIVYADVDQVLWGAAEWSVRAQLEYLAAGHAR